MWKLPFKLPMKKLPFSIKTIMLWGLFIFYSIIIVSYYYGKITEGATTMDLSSTGVPALNGNVVLNTDVANVPGIHLNDIYTNNNVPVPAQTGKQSGSSSFTATSSPTTGSNLTMPSTISNVPDKSAPTININTK